MKVLLFNGSPRKDGCTFTALTEVASTLERDGIDTEIIQLGRKPVAGCVSCRACAGKGRCVFGDTDGVNAAIDAMRECDGLVIGAPVYYASPNGGALAFLDRMFFAGSGEGFAFKPAAVVTSARRAGTTCSLDVLAKYPSICQMPLVTSQYWPMVHGGSADEAKQDLEGMQTMRLLGHNMAWMLKSLESARKAGIEAPQRTEERAWTNFIR